MKRVAVIGAGAAGLMCACHLPTEYDVTVFEKNAGSGAKLLITGKGRCNLTNLVSAEEFLKSVPHNAEFVSHAIKNFPPKDTVAFFEDLGIATKVEPGNRVFPVAGKANGVRMALENHARSRGVNFVFGATVQNINKTVDGFELVVNEELREFDAVVVATGGVTFPTTGSTGDGFVFAEKFGHKVLPPRASLCGLQLVRPTNLAGVSVECAVTVQGKNGKHATDRFVGNLLFTKTGVSGPVIFEVVAKFRGQCIKGHALQIEFLPNTLVPRSVAYWFFKKPSVPSRGSVKVAIKNFEPIEHATVTRGGVCVGEVNPQTMESKLVSGLYFIGEVLDVDAMSGGFNLQIAWSTGVAASGKLAQIDDRT